MEYRVNLICLKTLQVIPKGKRVKCGLVNAVLGRELAAGKTMYSNRAGEWSFVSLVE